MAARLAADVVMGVHFAFILFVGAGALLLLRWPRLVWLHLPAAVWGAGIVLIGGTCPLTPLENALRHAAGEEGYPGGFIEHYLLPLIYPAGLTPAIGVLLGLGVIGINALLYALAWRRWRARRAPR